MSGEAKKVVQGRPGAAALPHRADAGLVPAPQRVRLSRPDGGRPRRRGGTPTGSSRSARTGSPRTCAPLGLRHLDRVAVIAPNTPAMLEAHFGVPAAGLVLVPINTRLSADEIGYILEHSGAKVLFVDHEFEPLVRSRSTRAPAASSASTTPAPPAIPTRTSWPPARPSPASRGSRTSTRRSRSTTPRARPAGRRASWSITAAPTSTPSARRSRPACRSTPRTCGRCRCSTATAGASPGGSPRCRRDPRVPAPRRAGPGLGPDRRRGHHPLLRRADRADRDRQRSQGPPRSRAR